MNTEDAKDPAGMSEDELRAEVWFWRDEVACRLAAAVAGRDLPTVRLFAPLLDSAVGQDVDKCFACGEVIVPGQPAIRDVSEGEAHASCMGDHIEGDRYQLDPGSVCGDDDEPLEGHDGVLTSHPYAPVRTTAKIAELLTQADALLNEPIAAE